MNKLLASTDRLALDAVMTWITGVRAGQLPVQKQAQVRGLGTLKEAGKPNKRLYSEIKLAVR